MLKKLQKFGGAMFVPVLLFAFSGITVAIMGTLKNPQVVGSLATPGTFLYKLFTVIEEGGWTPFRQMPILFALGLPIGLAKKAQARACLESIVCYFTFNYFVGALLDQWGFGIDFSQQVGGTTGLASIGGVKTLDTGLIGAICIATLVVYLHDRFFDTKLPDFLGIFQGSSFVVIVAFFALLPAALLTVLVWPKIQMGIFSLQGFLSTSGIVGVWIYTFLERVLIPTGLHHFVYGPFIFESAVIPGGIQKYWTEHMTEFSMSKEPLKVLFPQGGFALHGNSKVFGCAGIALAMYSTAKKNKKKIVSGLLVSATLTAVLAGITEPLEFTFLFISPVLFVIHSLLAATMAATMYAFGVVGNMGGGLIEIISYNWLPMFKNHSGTIIAQIVIGLAFTGIYFIVFKTLILKMNIPTPGREDDDEAETKLYTKADYVAKKEGKLGVEEDHYTSQARTFLDGLGGRENIDEVTNCATRLRVSVKDSSKVKSDAAFRSGGAHGVVRKGEAIQVVVGLSVPQVREKFEELLKN